MSTHDNTPFHANAIRYRLWAKGPDNCRVFYAGDNTPTRWSIDPSKAKALTGDEARRLGSWLLEASNQDFQIEPYHAAYLKVEPETDSLLAEIIAMVAQGAVVVILEG